MVELDVYLSSDGQLVVIHDKIVDRTTGGTGMVGGMTLAELQKLDAGGGEKIPSLADVLLLLGARCSVNVELKGPGTAAPVAGLLESLDLATPHVAVEVNLELVPRAEHAGHRLAEGDRVEIVTLVGGG